MSNFVLYRQIPIDDSWDVIIVGGGPAGSAADSQLECTGNLAREGSFACARRFFGENLFAMIVNHPVSWANPQRPGKP